MEPGPAGALTDRKNRYGHRDATLILIGYPHGPPSGAVTPQPQITSPSSPPLADGSVVRSWIDVEVKPVTPELADNMGLNAAAGAFVVRPQTDSPAVKAGIMSGDVIIAVNGEPVRDARQLALSFMAVGKRLSDDLGVRCWRGERWLPG